MYTLQLYKVAIIFLFLYILSACGSGDQTPKDKQNTDTTVPEVVSVSPENLTTDIDLKTQVSVTFSESMKNSTITINNFSLSNGSAVPGTITLSENNTIATFTPDNDLAENTTYTATISTGVQDSAGNSISDHYHWTFSTEVFPQPVQALYSQAANWNDYVDNDGTTQFNATNTQCAGMNTSCLHGGEIRSMVIPGDSTCENLTAQDVLGVFDWVCDDSTTPIRILSVGLKTNKNLSDLIDFETNVWKENTVVVLENGEERFTSISAAWWDNSIIVDNDGGELATQNSIYLATESVNQSYTINGDGIAFVIQPGIVLSGPSTGVDIISANSQNYLWMEGAIDITGDDRGIVWQGVGFSVLRNIHTENANTGTFQRGVHLLESSFNRLSNIISENNGIHGLRLDSNSNHNVLSEITVSNNDICGLYMRDAEFNQLSNIHANGNLCGIYFYNLSNNNLLKNINTANNGYSVYLAGSTGNRLINIKAHNSGVSGVHIDSSSNNYLTGILATNNGISESNGGVVFSGATGSADGNFLSNITVANNYYSGVYLYIAENNSLANIAAVGNGLADPEFGGVMFSSSNNNTLINYAGSHGYYGISFWSAENNYVSGQLKLGNNVIDCHVDATTTPGVNSSCANVGNSDALYTPDISLASSFIGKIFEDDTQNTTSVTNSDGTAMYSDISDWFSFENQFRTWGKDGGTFPFNDQQGKCDANNCRIWDWTIQHPDTVIQNVLTARLSGEAANTFKHIWHIDPAPTQQSDCDSAMPGSLFETDHCENIALRNSVEIITDSVGNNNGLCESDEICLHTPNVGSYQGHGALVSAGVFTNGALTGITLMKYETNDASVAQALTKVSTSKPGSFIKNRSILQATTGVMRSLSATPQQLQLP
ncbi:MAG: Ig-like domain-containing protein [Gammaproteobacteria bacterium]|nr:Ig-like domain-containing protein [Gammaproteobacteria bacterium]